MFKRFFRVPGRTTSIRGTGLGLYICRQIVQAHSGEITVDSILGQGTTFFILLPYEQTKPT
jgi:signal transduction histidine kinase